MEKELENAVEMMIKTPLQKSKATDYLVSILIKHLIKEGLVDAEKFKQDLINSKDGLIVNDTEEEIPTLEDLKVNVLNACISDIESLDDKKD